MMIKNITTARV